MNGLLLQHLIINITYEKIKNSNHVFALLYITHSFIPVVHKYVPLETFSSGGQISTEYYVINILKQRINKYRMLPVNIVNVSQIFIVEGIAVERLICT